MPEISRFFGIIIRMYVEIGTSHNRPHFHAYYDEYVATYAIDRVELIAGQLPQRHQRFVEAWAEMHLEELLQDWNRLQTGKPAFKIDPLS